MTDREPKVGISIDIEADGKQFGHLSVPNSRNESGWGALHLPIVSIRSGAGPTVAFTGGNHGDEYEGPIALLKLARALAPSQISGRVIVIPALNFPAVMGGTRVSPIDGVNLIADDAGLYEALVDLGAEVREGDSVGRIHFPERPEREPVVYRAGTSGTVIGRCHKVLVGPGDFLALIAHDR